MARFRGPRRCHYLKTPSGVSAGRGFFMCPARARSCESEFVCPFLGGLARFFQSGTGATFSWSDCQVERESGGKAKEVRQMKRPSGGCGLVELAERLQGCIAGWKVRGWVVAPITIQRLEVWRARLETIPCVRIWRVRCCVVS